MRHLVFCVAVGLALAGCHLVDQRDFNAHAGEKPKPPAAPAGPPGPGALLTIDYARGAPNYAASLAQSVQNALAVKKSVLFSVRTLVPPAATPDAQIAELRDAAATGREIAESIVTDGADQAQVEQSVGTDASLHDKEVLVFVQ